MSSALGAFSSVHQKGTAIVHSSFRPETSVPPDALHRPLPLAMIDKARTNRGGATDPGNCAKNGKQLGYVTLSAPLSDFLYVAAKRCRKGKKNEGWSVMKHHFSSSLGAPALRTQKWKMLNAFKEWASLRIGQAAPKKQQEMHGQMRREREKSTDDTRRSGWSLLVVPGGERPFAQLELGLMLRALSYPIPADPTNEDCRSIHEEVFGVGHLHRS